MNTVKAEVKKAINTNKTVKANVKAEPKKAYSFSQFTNEYNKKADKLTLSVVRMEKGKTQAEKMTTSVSVKSMLSIFEKIKSIKDGLTKRKEALKAVKAYVVALKTIAPRAHVLRPIIECIKENYKKDYSPLLQKSFQR